MNHEILLISGIFFLCGIFAIIVRLLITNYLNKKKKRCVSITIGKVVEIVESSQSSSDDFGPYFRPVFEYSVNGENIRKTSSFGTNINRYVKQFTIGQQVEVHYNPLNSHDYYIVEEEPTIKFILKIFPFVGTLLLILAIMTK